jgi:hypothetical protein
MKKAAAAAPKAFTSFRKGQLWRIGEVNLMVLSVGKTLVHYKKYKAQPRGVQTTLISKANLQKYLLNEDAVLIEE